MQDMLTHGKSPHGLAECELVRDLATDPTTVIG